MKLRLTHLFISAILSIVATALLTGCNASGCTENQNSLPLAGFYALQDNGLYGQISIDSIDVGGVGAPGDSLLYPSGMKLSQIYLPLRSTVNSTSFFFHYTQKAIADTRLNDTITLGYTSTPYFVSEECGAMYRYNITSVAYTRHIIDSLAVIDSLITNTDIERIKIFFRTTTDDNPSEP